MISSDKALYIDGESYSELDFSQVPSNISAIQWDGLKGHIELNPDSGGNIFPNEKITALPIYVESIKPSWYSAQKLKELKDAEYVNALEQEKKTADEVAKNKADFETLKATSAFYEN